MPKKMYCVDNTEQDKICQVFMMVYRLIGNVQLPRVTLCCIRWRSIYGREGNPKTYIGHLIYLIIKDIKNIPDSQESDGVWTPR